MCMDSCSDKTSDTVRDHLMEERDYYLLPEAAWSKLTLWYGLSQNSRPLARKVIEHGMYMKHCKVEVYLLQFKLSIDPNLSNTKTCNFSRSDTVGDLEAALKEEFKIDKSACLLYTSPSPRDATLSRMPSSA